MHHTSWFAIIFKLGILFCTFYAGVSHCVSLSTPAPQIPSKLLTPLLAAELAIHRDDLGLAYELYAKIARESKDPGIAKRATKLALSAADPKAALEFSLIWVQQKPQDQEAQLIVSVLLTLDNQLSKAATHLAVILKQNPDKIEPFVNYYRQFEGTEKSLAKDVLEQLHTKFPKNILLKIILADLAYSEGHLDVAAERLAPILKLKSYPIEADILHIYILREENKREEALQFMKQRLKVMPDTVTLRREYFGLLLEAEQTKAAFKQLELLLTEKTLDPTILIELGRQAMEMAWYPQATQAFALAATSLDHVDIADYFLGRVFELEGKFEAAVLYFTQIESGPFHTLACVRAALILSQLKAYDKAILVLNNTYPQDETEQKQLYLTASEVLFAANRFNDGIKLMNEALTLFPKDPELIYAHSLHAEAINNIPLAEKDLQSILVAQPEHVDTLNALGFLLTNHTNRYTEAFAYLQKAHQLDPENPIVMDSIGWWYFRKGEIQESLKWLRAAFARYDDGEIAAHLGEVLWSQGEHNRALEIWHTALNQTPHHPILLETIGRVQGRSATVPGTP